MKTKHENAAQDALRGVLPHLSEKISLRPGG
jgi:hypothetical protein